MNPIFILKIIQSSVAVLLIVVILLQSKGIGLSSVFTSGSWLYRSRRGLERFLFFFTIFLAVMFLVTSFLVFYLSRS
ncbi:MAG: preprotein translocase subunit SecG [Patescibacteria group bacterium]